MPDSNKIDQQTMNFIFTSGVPSILSESCDYGIKKFPSEMPRKWIKGLEQFCRRHLREFRKVAECPQKNEILIMGYSSSSQVTVAIPLRVVCAQDHVGRKNFKGEGKVIYQKNLPENEPHWCLQGKDTLLPTHRQNIRIWLRDEIDPQNPAILATVQSYFGLPGGIQEKNRQKAPLRVWFYFMLGVLLGTIIIWFLVIKNRNQADTVAYMFPQSSQEKEHCRQFIREFQKRQPLRERLRDAVENIGSLLQQDPERTQESLTPLLPALQDRLVKEALYREFKDQLRRDGKDITLEDNVNSKERQEFWRRMIDGLRNRRENLARQIRLNQIESKFEILFDAGQNKRSILMKELEQLLISALEDMAENKDDDAIKLKLQSYQQDILAIRNWGKEGKLVRILIKEYGYNRDLAKFDIDGMRISVGTNAPVRLPFLSKKFILKYGQKSFYSYVNAASFRYEVLKWEPWSAVKVEFMQKNSAVETFKFEATMLSILDILFSRKTKGYRGAEFWFAFSTQTELFSKYLHYLYFKWRLKLDNKP